MDVHISVEIKTNQGTYKRVNSTPYNAEVSGSTWTPDSGVLLYPDRRAKKMRIWSFSAGDSAFRLVKTYELVASKTGNFAFVIVDTIDLSSYESAELLPIDGFNDEVEQLGNRVKASETNQPFLFRPDKTYYPGRSSHDKVRAFATNSLPLSDGQFGQYPLFVFFEHSIWALEQSRDTSIAFERESPVSTTHGLSNDKAIANVGRAVVFGYKGKYYYLSGSPDPEPLSGPVDSLVSGSEPIGYYDNGDDQELWLALADRTLIYNFTYRRWYGLDRQIVRFLRKENELLSLRSGGDIKNEDAPTGAAVATTINLEPIHFGEPDKRKRLFAAYFRGEYADSFSATLTYQDSGATVTTPAGRYYVKPNRLSEYSWKADITGNMTPGAGHNFHKIDAEIELRLPHKLRRANV